MRRKACPLKVPRLRMKDELLKAAPALANLLGEEIEDPEREYNANRLDTPRGHDEEITEAEELRQELASVKKDRAELLHSLTHIKTNLVGTGGGEAQRLQIHHLERELQVKKLTLNDLRTTSKNLAKRIANLGTEINDAKLLTPKGYEHEILTIKQLMGDISHLEEDLIEAEAKNRLYYLLGERTRQDHLEMEGKVRLARATKDDAVEDHATLTQMMHDMRAAKEEAERQLAQMKKILEDAKKDWMKKMKDRKKEVQELKRRQEREELKELKRKEQQEEDMRKEQDRLQKIALEQEAHEMQIQELAPKIEAMEASWNRLRTITGADEPEEVIAYWEGLKSKEENMRQLVANAEESEAAVKAKIEGLLCRRNEVLEADTSAPVAGEGTMDNAADFEMRIGDAHRKVEATRKRFERLRTVCISADQALKGMHARSQVALREIHPSELTPASKIPHGTPPRSTKRLERRESMMPRLGRRSDRNATPPVDEAAEKAAPLPPESPGTPPLLPGGALAGNTIEDDTFFEHLPGLLQEIGERLTKLLVIEADAVQAAAALGPAASMQPPVARESVVALDVEPLEQDEAAGDALDDNQAEPETDVEGERESASVEDGAADDSEAQTAEDDGVTGAGAEGAEATEEAAGSPEGDAAGQPAADGLVAGGTEGDDAGAEASPAGEEEVGGEGVAVEGAEEGDGGSTAAALVAEEAEAAAEAPVATADVPELDAAPALASPTFVQQPTLLDALLDTEEVVSDAELEQRMLMMHKQMPKLDWSGAPLMDTVNPDLKGVLPDWGSMSKRVKGRRRPDKAVALDSIMGYTHDDRYDEEEDDLEGGEGDDDKDAVVERDQIKRMAAKMEARAAKARAEAAE